MSSPSAAVIIPTRGRPELLKRCLRQLLPYVASHPECTVVVSDDGNAIETSAALAGECEGIRVVQGPRRGPAANRNFGASQSIGDLLIFLDDDCLPDKNLIAEYQAAAIQYPGCKVFEGRITAEGIATGFADISPSNETGGYLWSCNFGIRRDLFNSLGGFDERYPFAAMEDVDLRFRVVKQSQIIFLPQAFVSHAYERRTGMQILRHHTLSLLLYLHIHGLRATQRSPWYFLKNGIRLLYRGSESIMKRNASRDPLHLLRMIWVNLMLALITLFWGYRSNLVKILFPACCSNCESLQVLLNRRHVRPNMSKRGFCERKDYS